MAKTFSESYYGKNFNKKSGKLNVENGENREYLNFSLEGLNQPQIDVSDIEQVLERCSLYFSRCSEEGLRPGIASMCVWLGINRQRWLKWCNGAEFKHSHMAACQRINGIFDAQMESYMQNGKINPVSAIFIQKNNQGYTDVADKPTETKDSAIQERSMTEILKLASGKK